MAAKLKAIIFDMNGVFVKEPEKKILEKVCSSTGFGKVIAFSNFSLAIKQFQTGMISPFAFWKKVFPFLSEEDYKLRIESEYQLPFQLDKELYSLTKSLSKKYDLYCLSNSNFLQGKEYRRQNLYSPFKAVFLSHEQHSMKPFPKLYKKFLHATNLKASDCLFVDDSVINLIPAAIFGFKVVRYKDFFGFKNRLQTLGLL